MIDITRPAPVLFTYSATDRLALTVVDALALGTCDRPYIRRSCARSFVRDCQRRLDAVTVMYDAECERVMIENRWTQHDRQIVEIRDDNDEPTGRFSSYRVAADTRRNITADRERIREEMETAETYLRRAQWCLETLSRFCPPV